MLLFYYEKNELRAFVDDDGAWFVAADVAVALGYIKNTPIYSHEGCL